MMLSTCSLKKQIPSSCTGIVLLTMGFSLLYANDGAGQKIVIDGNADDWSLVPPLLETARPPTTEQKQKVAIQQLKVGSDAENLYIYGATNLPPLTAIEGISGGVAQGIFVLYLDTDGDASTGCEDLELHGDNNTKLSGFDLQLYGLVGRDAGSLIGLGAKDGPFARYDTYEPRNGSFAFRDRKRIEGKYSVFRKAKVALCPMGIELALPLEKYKMKPGAKIRLFVRKLGAKKGAAYGECEYQIPASK